MTTSALRRALAGSLVGATLTAGLCALPGAAFGATPASTSTTVRPPRHTATTLASTPTTTTPTTTTSTPSSGPAASGSGSVSSPVCVNFAQAQQTVESELSGRVTQLDTLVSRVDAATGLTSSDKAALLADLTGTELPGIAALQTKVEGDTRCIQLRADAYTMVFEYRVYLVMTPQTDLVILNDAATNAEGVLAGLEPTISGWIAYAQAHGVDVSGAESAFSDYQAKVTTAQGLTTGQSATLLAQTPAGCPGNRSVFLQARTNLSNAHQDLHAARNDMAQIITDLG